MNGILADPSHVSPVSLEYLEQKKFRRPIVQPVGWGSTPPSPELPHNVHPPHPARGSARLSLKRSPRAFPRRLKPHHPSRETVRSTTDHGGIPLRPWLGAPRPGPVCGETAAAGIHATPAPVPVLAPGA